MSSLFTARILSVVGHSTHLVVIGWRPIADRRRPCGRPIDEPHAVEFSRFMKISFSDRENQHLEATPAPLALGWALGFRPPALATSSQVHRKRLTKSRLRGNLLVKYENMILIE
jgi:hypothetical protein